MVRTIPKGKLIAVDTEGTGLNPWTGDRPFAVSFSNKHGETGYMRWPVCPWTRRVFPKLSDLQELHDFFKNLKRVKVFHNAPYDLRSLYFMGVIPQRMIGNIDCFEETFFAISLCNSQELNRGLKPLCKKYVKFDDADEKILHKSTVAGRSKAKAKGWNISDEVKADFWLADPELCKDYAIKDAQRTILLWEGVLRHWLYQRNADESYRNEKRVLWANWKLMERGVRVDRRMLKTKKKDFDRAVQHHKKKVFQSVGYEFEISKDKQLRQALFNDPVCPHCIEDYDYSAGTLFHDSADCDYVTGLGLTPSIMTDKTQQPSVSWKALQKLKHPVITHIAEHDSNEKASQAMSNYENYLQYENGEYIIHPNYKQIEAKTGRQSCVKPNLTNVSNPETSMNKHAKQTRDPYGPRKHCNWFAFDYSKQEAWIFACFAEQQLPKEEQTLLNWARTGKDPYSETANLAWGQEESKWIETFGRNYKGFNTLDLMSRFNYDIVKAEKEIKGTKSIRAIAKSVWLGINYGMGTETLAKTMKKDETEAAILLEQVHSSLPILKIYSGQLQQVAKQQGYIRTWFNRPIDIDRWFTYRAVNYQIQGTAADQVKLGLIELDKYFEELRARGYGVWTVLSIHDEIIIEIDMRTVNAQELLMILRGVRKRLEKQYFTIRIKTGCERIEKSWDSKEVFQF